jgi:glycosyltransferase involved in cell wall biosynthesis
MTELLFCLSVYFAVHPFFVYPRSLIWIKRFSSERDRQINNASSTSGFDTTHHSSTKLPRVALVISTYNEASVIGAKLQNSQALDYPSESLRFFVLSDACTDETVSIAQEFPKATVFRSTIRKGKSAVLEEFVPEIDADILVFSDANSLYDPQAIRFLVAQLADPMIGYVVGQQRYEDIEDSPAAEAENVYWNRESWVKSLESELGAVVGGDGAITAIRRSDYVPSHATDESDFYVPLKLAIRGLSGVYEPRAFCQENASEHFAGQFFRKIRIVNRSLSSTFRCLPALNPLRVGLFAYMLWSHKVLRWLLPVNLLLAAFCLGRLAAKGSLLFQLLAIPPFVVLLSAVLYLLPGFRRFRPIYLSFYFCSMNLAVLIGLISFILGYRVTTWKPDRD